MTSSNNSPLRDPNFLSILELKSRLNSMDVDFNPNVKPKSYYYDLYSHAVKDPANRKKIEKLLKEDCRGSVNPVTSKLRFKEDVESDDLLQPKQSKKSLNILHEMKKEIEGKEIFLKSETKIVKSGEDLANFSDNQLLKQKQRSPRSSPNRFINESNRIKTVSLAIPNLMRGTVSSLNPKEVRKEVSLMFLPRKSYLVFKKKSQINKSASMSVIIVVVVTFCAIFIYYAYQHKDELSVTVQDVFKKMMERSKETNFSRAAFAFLVILLVSYMINCSMINSRIAKEIVADVESILEDSNDELDNFVEEEKMIDKFAEKYDMHFFTFESEIIPRVREEFQKSGKISVVSNNGKIQWKLEKKNDDRIITNN